MPHLVPQVVSMETIYKRTTSRVEAHLIYRENYPDAFQTSHWNSQKVIPKPGCGPPTPPPSHGRMTCGSSSSGCMQPPSRERHLWCPVGLSESRVALHVSTRVKSLMRLGNFLSGSGGLLTQEPCRAEFCVLCCGTVPGNNKVMISKWKKDF